MLIDARSICCLQQLSFLRFLLPLCPALRPRGLHPKPMDAADTFLLVRSASCGAECVSHTHPEDTEGHRQSHRRVTGKALPSHSGLTADTGAQGHVLSSPWAAEAGGDKCGASPSLPRSTSMCVFMDPKHWHSTGSLLGTSAHKKHQLNRNMPLHITAETFFLLNSLYYIMYDCNTWTYSILPNDRYLLNKWGN